MNTELIRIPVKDTDDADWVAPLKKYIEQYFGSSAEFIDNINQFNKLRADLKHANKDVVGRDMYYKYYGQLELLELRIPIGFGAVKVDFKWHEAFKPKSAVSQSSMAYEKASILFNLASILSHVGADALENDEFKLGYQSFQNAAGIYEFISLNFLKAPTDDLNPKTVKALQKLMLAQAQEVFVLNLITSNSPNVSLVSRLCKATYQFYKSAKDLLREDSKRIADKSWAPFCGIKELYFHSLSYYYQALNNKTADKYGLAIAYMTQAQAILAVPEKGACLIQLSGPKRTHIMDTLKDHTERMTNELKLLEKDNDLIYHAIIPIANTLPEIKALESVKSVPINEQGVSTLVGKDLFEKIIPLNVSTQSSLYSEEQAKLLRSENEKLDIATQEYKSTLEFLKLPKTLIELRELVDEDFEEKLNSGRASSSGDDDNEIDPRVLSIAMEMNQNPINELKNQDIRNQIFNFLQNSEKLLKEDEESFNQYKGQYGNSFNVVQFTNESLQIQQSIQNYKKTLLDSEISDNKLKSTIEPFREDIKILSLGPNHPTFINSFKVFQQNDAMNSLNQQVSLLDIDDFSSKSMSIKELKGKLEKIDTKLQDLRYLQEERQNTYQDLKDAVHKDDITSILVLNSDEQDIDKLFAKELLKFSNYQERISTTIEKQASLINILKGLMSEVLDDPTVKKNSKLKKDRISTKSYVTNRYLKAYESWGVFKSGVTEGGNFYNQLYSIAETLFNRALKYSQDRKNEFNSAISRISSDTELRQRMSQYNSSVSSTQSPKSSFAYSPAPAPAPASYSSYSVNSYQQQQSQPPQVNTYQSQSQSQPPLPHHPSASNVPPAQYSSYQASASPMYQSQPPAPLPRHPSASSGAPPPIPPTPYQQQPSQQPPQGSDFYSTKSTYDPSMYSSYNHNQYGNNNNYR